MEHIIIANWKSNPDSVIKARGVFSGILKLNKNLKNKKIVICPPYPYLFLGDKLKSPKIFLGAQNTFIDTEGSFTGEVKAEMLKSMNVKYVIVGHSERRKIGDSDEYISKQITTILKNKLIPILCVGEIKRDHDGHYLSFVKNQIVNDLSGINKNSIKNIIIAYEPVWAIGKGAVREATGEEFTEMKIYIRKVLSDLYGANIAKSVKIFYGGSVKKDNAKIFIDSGADGLLIGRDSLDVKKIEAIIKSF